MSKATRIFHIFVSAAHPPSLSLRQLGRALKILSLVNRHARSHLSLCRKSFRASAGPKLPTHFGEDSESRALSVSGGIRSAVALLLASVIFSFGCIHTIAVYAEPSGAQAPDDSKAKGQTAPAPLRIKKSTEPVLPASEMNIDEPPREFEHALRLVTDELFIDVNRQRKLKKERLDVRVVIDPVVDANTGEVTKISERIERMIEDEARLMFPRFTVSEMNSKNIGNADYVISGIVPLERYRGNADADKVRHLSLSILDKKTGQIVAHSGVWIANEELDFELTPMYRDSPMYMKDKRVEALIATAKAAAGSLADKEYFDSLATTALLDEASRAYDQGNHLLALGLFAKAAARSDGKVMKTFSGLYESFFKLKRYKEAEQAFASLTELGMQNGNLSFKFLFNVNATDFFGGREVRNAYKIWLHEIASAILASKNCVQIIGHASHSGTKEYNLALSLRRAELIQAKLQAQAPGVARKTTTIGRGFAENIIGTGTDDARDAIDRRVEFKIV